MKQTTQNPALSSFFPSNPIKDAIGDSFQNLPVGYFDTLGTPFVPYISTVYQNSFTSTTSAFVGSVGSYVPSRIPGLVDSLPYSLPSPVPIEPDPVEIMIDLIRPEPVNPFLSNPFLSPIEIPPMPPIDAPPAPIDPDPLGTFIDSLPTPAPVDPDPLGSFIDSLPTPPDPSPPSVPSSPTPDAPDAPDPGDDTSTNEGLGDSNGRGDPIVLDLTGDGFNLLDSETSSAHFDILGGGKQYQTGWAGEGNGLLAYDVDNDSLINHRSEIAFIDYKPGAKTDLEGLTAFDTNQNGWFEKADDKWNQFGVWEDKNVDGITDSGEYNSLDSLSIQSIHLTSDHQQSMMNGNIIHGVTQVVMQNGSFLLAADVSFNVSNQSLM